MRITVAGCGKVGSALAKQLTNDNHDVTLIDTDPAVLNSLQERTDVMTAVGNCASMSVLREARIENCETLVAATGSDVINLLCCATARHLNPGIHTIARIRDPDYAAQARAMRQSFGLSLVVTPERLAAEEIHNLIKYPGFLKRQTLIKSNLKIVELQVDAKSPLRDVPLNSLYSTVKCQVLVCAVLRDGQATVPDGNFILKTGDRLFVTAQSENLSMLLKNLGVITHKAKKVILAGGGRIAFYLAEKLHASGISVTIIETNPETCTTLASLLPPDVNIVCGDASDMDLLENEGLPDSDTLVTLTGFDEQNMVISLYGNNCGIPQIITKISREENSRLMSTLPIGSVIVPRSLCCNDIITYIHDMDNRSGDAKAVHTIADGQADAYEFSVGPELQHRCKIPLKNLKLKPNIRIAALSRGSSYAVIPYGDTELEVGDTLVIVSIHNPDDSNLKQLNDIFA